MTVHRQVDKVNSLKKECLVVYNMSLVIALKFSEEMSSASLNSSGKFFSSNQCAMSWELKVVR